MKRFWILLAVVALLFLVLFGIAEALHIPLLTDPLPQLSAGGAAAMLIGVGLLIIDVILPVPSSVVMTAHGALFGILAGAALSLLGRMGSFSLGYYLGRHSTKLVRRFIGADELRRASTFIDRHGTMAIIGSRPLPILSETVSIASGIGGMPFMKSLLAAVTGSLPEAALFAYAGAIAGTFVSTAYVFLGVVVLMLIFWSIGNSKPETSGRTG
ncbi:MAG TPA: VTT domain-containing protein [Candidatus Saccharimonadales bacterium]|jgi:uncharacterized membrane protein YdjX (TVP38/TMEM64 family)